MFGVKDYEPHFYTSGRMLADEMGNQLRQLIGRPFSNAYLMWDQDADEWFPDGPVIMQFEDIQLEVCATRVSELAVTEEKIDLSQPIDWYGTPLTLIWKKNPLDGLQLSIGKRVERISILEYPPALFGQMVGHGWALFGIELKLTNSWFSVFNAGDEIGIQFKENLEAPIRKTALASL